MKKCFILLLPILLFCGCHSDQYYQSQAIDRARRFLLENCRDLNHEQINFVRFNTPFLLHSPVLTAGSDYGAVAEKMPQELHQVCVSWIIPGKKDVYMVFGVSTARMSDWYPSRVIRKNVDKYTAVLPGEAAKCAAYARNNFFEQMSVKESNIVRFTMPYLLSTDFELNFDPAGDKSSAELEKLRQASLQKKQYSLVWKLPGRNLVFAGLGNPKFTNWNIMMAGFMDDAELSRHTVAELMMPADYYKPFPVEKELPEAAK